jgi:LysM repeat protein
MESKTSASARIFAAIALIGATLVVIVLVAASIGGDSSSDRPRPTQTAKQQQQSDPDKPAPANYVVQTGDTLTSIARETGVPVAEILALNPEVDPQILIAGQTLKLR